MEKKIKIFGHIDYGDAGNPGVTVDDIVAQLGYENTTSIHVQINSQGGGVVEGRAIRAYLNSLNVPITTEAFGECSSIATEIFLMGRERIVHEGITFLVHFPSGGAFGTAEDIASYNADLIKKQQEMIDLYYERCKGRIGKKLWAEMMKKQTTLSAQYLYEIGFATKIVKSYQALNLNNNNMKKISLAKAMRALGLKNFFKSTALDLQLADGGLITVVTEAETPQVGDAVIFTNTGEPVPDGEHQLSDGTIVITTGGIITEIIPAVSDQAQTTEDLTALVAVLAEKVKALEAQQQNWEVLMKNAFGENSVAKDVRKTAQSTEKKFVPKIKKAL
jgi:ATP-dependent protease ClpP protease subunit